MPTFADTISSQANFSEIIDIINMTAEVMELEFAVMSAMVTRHDIPRGQDRVRIPFQDVTMEAQAHTDGDEIQTVQRFSLDTIDLTTSELQITYRISKRAMRFSSQDLAMLAGQEQAKAATEALEVRLLALLDDTGTQDLGASGAATTLTHVRTTRRMLRNISRANGGPAKPPIVGVINAIQEEDLLADLGVQAAMAQYADGNTQRIPRPGFLAELVNLAPTLEDAYFGDILRIPFFVSGYVADTVAGVTAPSIGGVFAKNALHLGISAEWDVEPFSEVEWPGLIVRAMTDYGQRVGPYPQKVVQFDTAVS